MKICMISKYPPIEGGVSSRVYWLAKALGERGHEVHIVTNALEVENEYREVLDLNDPNYMPKNVFVHNTDPSPSIQANPNQIPFSKKYCEKLASLAIDVIEEYNIDLIDSRYLVPYAVSGYLAKSLLKVPQLISHAGSDLQRLYPSRYLNSLLKKILNSADGIITTPKNEPFFTNLGVSTSKIFFENQLIVDTQAFNPNVLPFNLDSYCTNQRISSDIPIIGYIGKITTNYKTKGLLELLNACSKIDKRFLLVFQSNGKKLGEFKLLIEKLNLTEKTCFLPFLPPWKIPSILKSLNCVISLEKRNSPTLEYTDSTIPAEVIFTGKCVLMSQAVHAKEHYKNLKDKEEVFVVDTNNLQNLRNILLKIIQNPDLANTVGKNGREAIMKDKQNFRLVDKTIEIYKKLIT